MRRAQAQYDAPVAQDEGPEDEEGQADAGKGGQRDSSGSSGSDEEEGSGSGSGQGEEASEASDAEPGSSEVEGGEQQGEQHEEGSVSVEEEELGSGGAAGAVGRPAFVISHAWEARRMTKADFQALGLPWGGGLLTMDLHVRLDGRRFKVCCLGWAWAGGRTLGGWV